MIKDRYLQLASLKLLHTVKDEATGKQVHFSKLIKYGIIPVNNSGVMKEVNEELADFIIDVLGIKAIEWSSSFHKSWDKVATAPIEQLIAEQIVNYFSVYGMESLGFNSINYIPVEKILIDFEKNPSLESFTVVRFLNEKEIKSEIKNFICDVYSPHKDSIGYIKDLLFYVKDIDLDSIRSFEVKVMYCDVHDIVPIESQDFLRLAIYKASNGKVTTIVKDKYTINLLKSFASNMCIEKMFMKADLKRLSESFFRFKPLFLAFKQNKRLANTINKIRRYATSNHKPVSGFVVSNLMNLLALGKKEEANKVIEKAGVRELVKLINFAQYEAVAKDHIFNIRNGKIFVKIEDEEKNTNIIRLSNLEWLNQECTERLKALLNNVYSGMIFYIQKEIEYAVPVSEKQMMGVLPYGTRVNLPEDAKAICIGGHWFNQDTRIDLDFHLNSVNNSFGWNSSYRLNNKDILFSGDMTDAPKPNGAVEAYRISSNVKEDYILSVNVFNTSGDIPYELLFTKDVTSECEFEEYEEDMISAVINPENAIAPKLDLTVHGKEGVIGFYKDKSFILYGGDICGGYRVPNKQFIKNVLSATISKCKNMMTIREFIELAGGKTIDTVEGVESYIDLSIGSITTITLFNILNFDKDKFNKISSKPDTIAKIG